MTLANSLVIHALVNAMLLIALHQEAVFKYVHEATVVTLPVMPLIVHRLVAQEIAAPWHARISNKNLFPIIRERNDMQSELLHPSLQRQLLSNGLP